MNNWPKIDLTKEEIQRCWDFSQQIINTKNQYDRMNKAGLTDDEQLQYRIKRTFAGKLGEYAFHKYLISHGYKDENFDNMFTIFNGETNVDDFDFVCKNNESIDVKTAVFNNHTKLVVPIDQFDSIPKDYYVGVKLNLDDSIKSYSELDISSISSVYICGYAEREYLETRATTNLGEYDCKSVWLGGLLDINRLLTKMEIDEDYLLDL